MACWTRESDRDGGCCRCKWEFIVVVKRGKSGCRHSLEFPLERSKSIPGFGSGWCCCGGRVDVEAVLEMRANRLVAGGVVENLVGIDTVADECFFRLGMCVSGVGCEVFVCGCRVRWGCGGVSGVVGTGDEFAAEPVFEIAEAVVVCVAGAELGVDVGKVVFGGDTVDLAGWHGMW